MKLEELNKNIKQHKVSDSLIIFKNTDSDFIANQYITEIANQHNLTKVNINDLSEIKTSATIFDKFMPEVLYIYRTDKFTFDNVSLTNNKNIIISCNSMPKKIEALFEDYVVTVPKLETWQLKDFALTQLVSVDEPTVDWLIQICNNNIDRIALEVDRIKVFSEDDRQYIVADFNRDYIYGDLTQYKIYDFTNAIITRNFSKVASLYNELINLDYSPFGLMILLYNNFKTIIEIQTDASATAEKYNINPRQFNAIKHNINYYTNEQLAHIFLILTGLDKEIKSGNFDTNLVLDYLLTNIFK